MRLKNSNADKVTIELETISARKVVLTIADNGKGFRDGSGPQAICLQNMKYRAGVIEGNLKISTSLGIRTRVQCTLTSATTGRDRPSQTLVIFSVFNVRADRNLSYIIVRPRPDCGQAAPRVSFMTVGNTIRRVVSRGLETCPEQFRR
jgi:hypothetical protein